MCSRYYCFIDEVLTLVQSQHLKEQFGNGTTAGNPLRYVVTLYVVPALAALYLSSLS